MSMLPRLLRRIDARNARERWLIAGTVIAVLVLFADQLVLQPLLETRSQSIREQGKLQASLRGQAEEMTRLRIALAKDPNAVPRRELAQLERERDQFDRRIAEITGHLIEPREMAQVLEAMLSRAAGLELVALENLEPAPLDGGTAESTSETQAFRHGLRVELRGSFNATHAYLNLLEALPWGLFWDRLDIVAGDYPDNRVTIEVYTVTVGREWLDV